MQSLKAGEEVDLVSAKAVSPQPQTAEALVLEHRRPEVPLVNRGPAE